MTVVVFFAANRQNFDWRLPTSVASPLSTLYVWPRPLLRASTKEVQVVIKQLKKDSNCQMERRANIPRGFALKSDSPKEEKKKKLKEHLGGGEGRYDGV